jgi:hypothetical protein
MSGLRQVDVHAVGVSVSLRQRHRPDDVPMVRQTLGTLARLIAPDERPDLTDLGQPAVFSGRTPPERE